MTLDESVCSKVNIFTWVVYLLTGSCRADTPNDQYAEAMTVYSKYAGYFSITSWLFAQIPQLIKNYREKDVAGLSAGFLATWFAGDALNFCSCFLNDAMAFQYLLSGYYCMIDLVLGSQYIYYSYYYKGPRFGCSVILGPQSPGNSLRSAGNKSPNVSTFHSGYATRSDFPKEVSLFNTTEYYPAPETELDPLLPEYHDGMGNPPEISEQSFSSTLRSLKKLAHVRVPTRLGGAKKMISGFAQTCGTILMFAVRTRAAPLPVPLPVPLPIRLLNGEKHAADVEGTKTNNSIIFQILHLLTELRDVPPGKLFGWLSASFYVVSRIPQILTNIQIQSTAGVSLKLIAFALMGNLFYAVSLATSKDALLGGDVTSQFWRDELCYFVGAVGTVMFDAFVLCQHWYYDILEYGARIIEEIEDEFDGDDDDDDDNTDGKDNDKDNDKDNARKSKSSNTPNSKAGRDAVPQMIQATPIKYSTTPLSPEHMRKLSELTPLTPIDFLLEEYHPLEGSSDSGSHGSNGSGACVSGSHVSSHASRERQRSQHVLQQQQAQLQQQHSQHPCQQCGQPCQQSPPLILGPQVQPEPQTQTSQLQQLHQIQQLQQMQLQHQTEKHGSGGSGNSHGNSAGNSAGSSSSSTSLNHLRPRGYSIGVVPSQAVSPTSGMSTPHVHFFNDRDDLEEQHYGSTSTSN